MFDLLKNWLTGNIDAKSERKLDKSAKDDPFLADALEGYRSMPEADHAAAVDRLKARLNNEKKDRGAIIWWRVAAAAIVLIGLGITFWMNTPKVDLPIATTEPITTPTESAANDLSDAIAQVATPPSDSLVQNPETPTTSSTPITDKPKGELLANIDEPVIVAPKEELFDSVSIVSKPEDIAKTTPTIPTQTDTISKADTLFNDIAEVPPTPDVQLADPVAEVEIQEPDIPSSKAIDAIQLKGIVLDEETGEGLIGANVLIEGTADGTTADFDGVFSLMIAELPITILVNYIGYESKQIVVGSVDQQLEITLSSEGMALEEVVISSKRNRRSKAKKKKQKAEPSEPQPKKGFNKFKRYLKKEMRYPDAARENGVEGTLSLSFYINASGRPENITVLNSLGYGLDEEAIRLLENGPDWEPTNRSASYELEFGL